VKTMKATELKAQPLDSGQLDRWLSGKIPRRILVAPFGGKLKASLFGHPDDEYGRDLDGEYFHPGTDFFGTPRMKANRDRLVDWHHVMFGGQKDPAPGRTMKGAVLGRMILDPEAEKDGMWADFWANAGEERRRLVAFLERKSVPLYNSTQPISGAIKYGKAGAIDVWPIRFDTISTAPQNDLAIVPPLKALLADPSFSDFSGTALAAALAESDDLDSYLAGTSETGQLSAKAGRVLSSKTRAQLYELARALSEFVRQYDPSAPLIEVPDNE
jgi:hypothetical protein